MTMENFIAVYKAFAAVVMFAAIPCGIGAIYARLYERRGGKW